MGIVMKGREFKHLFEAELSNFSQFISHSSDFFLYNYYLQIPKLKT